LTTSDIWQPLYFSCLEGNIQSFCGTVNSRGGSRLAIVNAAHVAGRDGMDVGSGDRRRNPSIRTGLVLSEAVVPFSRRLRWTRGRRDAIKLGMGLTFAAACCGFTTRMMLFATDAWNEAVFSQTLYLVE
jgi:hypothetical protein